MSAEAPEQKIQVEQDKKKLYIKWDISSDQLKEAFGKFGAVADARVVPTGRIRPFAFVNFETEEAAAKAMAAMQGKTLTTSPLTVEFATAGPPKAKKAKAPKPAPAAGEAKQAEKPKKERKPKQPKEANAAAPAAGGDAAAGATPAAAGEKKAKKPRVRKPKKAAEGEAAAAASSDAAAAAPVAAAAESK